MGFVRKLWRVHDETYHILIIIDFQRQKCIFVEVKWESIEVD